MTPQEINRLYPKTESLTDKIIASVSFFAFVTLILFL